MSPSTIHDFGGADPDRLGNPPLGGTGGWADAVRNDLVRLEAEKATDADVAAIAATVPAAITDHEAKVDPHPVYLKPSEIVAGANITVTEDAGVVTIAGQAGGGGGASTLDALTDVTAPANTPAGKVLGTTAEGVWGPVDPPAGGGGGGASTLDALTDVVAPANTPAGKVLGTTAEGVWGPIDPPAGGGGGGADTNPYVGPTPPANPAFGQVWIELTEVTP